MSCHLQHIMLRQRNLLATPCPSGHMQAGSRGTQGVELPYQLWVAELGKPETVWLYHPDHNRLDVMDTVVGLAYRLKWKLSETEIALYESPYSQYSEPVEVCPIIDGRAQITRAHALKGKGMSHICPLGVASGSMLWQLAEKDFAAKKQE